MSTDSFATDARRWLESMCDRSTESSDHAASDIAIFHSLSHEAELAVIRQATNWQATKYDAGYGAIHWSAEFGGAGLTDSHDRLFGSLEAEFATAPDHELRRITTNLVAPVLRDFGTSEQQTRFIVPFLRAQITACQLFSEPSAGSDLANVGTRARAEGEHWRVDGSKVWVSGAQFADFGLLIARTDPDAMKLEGLTAFLVPMGSPGVDVRPIRQLTGGSSFNEVYFDGLILPDDLRIGQPGQGWKIALAMLSYERRQSGGRQGVGASLDQLLDLARRSGRATDPVVRQSIAQTYIHERLRSLTRQRSAEAQARGAAPGPEGSLGKLLWVEGLTAIGETAALLTGPLLVAEVDSDFAWGQQILGAPGFHIAGGSDEIQRNILGERLLGLPREPRPDLEGSWKDSLRR